MAGGTEVFLVSLQFLVQVGEPVGQPCKVEAGHFTLQRLSSVVIFLHSNIHRRVSGSGDKYNQGYTLPRVIADMLSNGYMICRV